MAPRKKAVKAVKKAVKNAVSINDLIERIRQRSAISRTVFSRAPMRNPIQSMVPRRIPITANLVDYYGITEPALYDIAAPTARAIAREKAGPNAIQISRRSAEQIKKELTSLGSTKDAAAKIRDAFAKVNPTPKKPAGPSRPSAPSAPKAPPSTPASSPSLDKEAEKLASLLLMPHATKEAAIATKDAVVAKMVENPALEEKVREVVSSGELSAKKPLALAKKDATEAAMTLEQREMKAALAATLTKRRTLLADDEEEAPGPAPAPAPKKTGKLDPALRALIGATVSGGPPTAKPKAPSAAADPVDAALVAVAEALKPKPPPLPPRAPGSGPPPPPPLPPPKAKAGPGKFAIVVPGTESRAPSSSTSKPKPTVSAEQKGLLEEMAAKLKRQQEKIEGTLAPAIVDFARPVETEAPNPVREALQARLRAQPELAATVAKSDEVDDFGDALQSKGYILQSVSFPSSQWKTPASIRWLRSNGIAPMKKSHKVGRNYIYTVASPKLFSKYYTSDLMSRGRKIELIYGK